MEIFYFHRFKCPIIREDVFRGQDTLIWKLSWNIFFLTNSPGNPRHFPSPFPPLLPPPPKKSWSSFPVQSSSSKSMSYFSFLLLFPPHIRTQQNRTGRDAAAISDCSTKKFSFFPFSCFLHYYIGGKKRGGGRRHDFAKTKSK